MNLLSYHSRTSRPARLVETDYCPTLGIQLGQALSTAAVIALHLLLLHQAAAIAAFSPPLIAAFLGATLLDSCCLGACTCAQGFKQVNKHLIQL
jgi:hypothetical protein